MNNQEFRQYAHQMADWMADYLENIEDKPVRSQVRPGDVYKQLPVSPPSKGESMDSIIDDVNKIILPGITNWQSPNFFAYFPANSSYPSVLAEMMTATFAAQCMVWETSPAAAELEEKVMNWLKEMTGIPMNFEGVIQDSASTSTLVAILSAREKASAFSANENGIEKNRFRVYCSAEAHSSVEKAVKVAGIGRGNLRKIAVDHQLAMIPDQLEQAIVNDIRDGLLPACVIAAIGTTGTVAMDPLGKIAEICRKYDVWLHVDAAYAGSAMVLQQYRYLLDGIELADSYVFNPHKWMFTNFDCSAYFIRDKQALLKTFSITPEYLKTAEDKQVNNYRDWGVPLGRRFRALKLWFVMRTYGVAGMQQKIRDHIAAGQWIKEEILENQEIELMAPAPFNLVCFRFHPAGINDESALDLLNEKILNKINHSGKVFLTHTRLNGRFVIRFVAGQTHTTLETVKNGWKYIIDTAVE